MKALFLKVVLLLVPFVLWADAGFDDFGEFEDDLEVQLNATQVPDPLETLNRGIWWVNDKGYFYLLKPVARGYGAVLPEPGRKSVANAFRNLEAPERFVNNVLQMKFEDAGTELKRFVCNSTVGVLGLSDPARDTYGMKEAPEDFGLTMAHYGVSPMMALHLPLFGPSNLRDTVGMIPDMFLSPISYIESLLIRVAVHSEKVVNDTSLRIGLYERLKEEHVDLYRFLQDAYEQRRDAQIRE